MQRWKSYCALQTDGRTDDENDSSIFPGPTNDSLYWEKYSPGQISSCWWYGMRNHSFPDRTFSFKQVQTWSCALRDIGTAAGA